MQTQPRPAIEAGSSSRQPTTTALALAALGLASCALHSYEAEPLPPNQLDALATLREAPEMGDPETPLPELTLRRAAEWLRTRGPRVRETIAAFRTAFAKARVATPWPNPILTAGPEFGFGSTVDVNEVVPFASLGLTIPLSGRLGRQDDVNESLARAARADALATFRELYLDLRARFVRLAVAQQREAVRGSVLAAAEASLAATQQLVAAGAATALDVSLFQLEHAREKSRVLTARIDVTNAASDLSDLVAVSPGRLGLVPDSALPATPTSQPEPTQLRELIEQEHPELLRIRAEYEVAERRLHLEIAKQYPDLTFGPSFRGEVGERKTILGLSLGIELPMFDRNQQAIAEAVKRREEVRTMYETRAHGVLSAVERASGTLRMATEQHRILRDEVLPAATANVDIARQSIAAGSAGALQLLDAERSLRQVQLEVLEARLSEQLAWSDLEKAVGFPLVEFRSDPGGEGRTPPQELTGKHEDAAGERR